MTAPAPIPFRRLDRKAAARGPAWAAAAGDVLARGGWRSDERPLEPLERAIAAWCEVECCVATASGSAALLLAMLGFGVGPGDEVVTVGNTYAATVASIRLAGATPVLADVERDSYTMSAGALERALSPRTRLVVPVHLFGRPAAMEAIAAVAAARGVPVLEEACQAFGARRDGRPAGSLGDAAVFSFGRSKAIGGPGEGGALVTRDRGLGAHMRLLANQGRRDGDHVAVGSNLRADPIAAAMLAAELDGTAAVLARRREIARRYDEELVRLGLRQPPDPSTEHGLYVYVVEPPDRARFRAALERRGIGTAVHYPRPIHEQTAYARVAHDGLPVTREVAARVVSLPCDEYLTDDEAERVAAAAAEAARA